MTRCFEPLEETSMHLGKRIKKRAGIPKRAQERYTKIIEERGCDIEDIQDENFKKYLYSVLKDDCHLKIYGQYILVISNSGVGVTLLRVPKKYMGRKPNGNSRCNKNPSDFTFSEV